MFKPRIIFPLFLAAFLFWGCPKKQVVKGKAKPVPEEEVVEKVIAPEETLQQTAPEIPERPELKLERIFFDFDKSDIREDAATGLKKNAEMLKLYPEVKIIIEGHCCRIGTAEYNLALGERRAKAARDYLLMLGITPDRMSIVSYGEERPLDPNNLPRNRRCEFVIKK